MLSEQEKKDLIRKNWLLKDIPEVPFLIEIGPFHGATSKYFESDAAELQWNLEFHRSREAVYDYGMPNLKPNMGTGIIASAFGCQFTVNSEADPWVCPLIHDGNIAEVRSLELPNVRTNSVYGRARERVMHFQRQSQLPLRLVNIPSPLVTASLIWDYTSFVAGTILHPQEVHLLMEKVTQATIEYIREQLNWIQNLHTMSHEMWYLPRELGVRVSDDTAALLSPDLYREFGVKYNSMISRAFGGIVVHSCGDLQNVAGVMMETEGLRGLDITIPQNTRWDLIKEAAAGKTALNLRHYYWDHGAGTRADLAAYSEKLIQYFGRCGVFIQTGTPTASEAVELGRKLHETLC